MAEQVTALPVGPQVLDACDKRDCGRPRAEHREGFMDQRESVIDHDYDQPPLSPYDHERVPALILTAWRCHVCRADHDVWGTGADEGYMECDQCGAWSWLVFDPDGYYEAGGTQCPQPPPRLTTSARARGTSRE